MKSRNTNETMTPAKGESIEMQQTNRDTGPVQAAHTTVAPQFATQSTAHHHAVEAHRIATYGAYRDAD